MYNLVRSEATQKDKSSSRIGYKFENIAAQRIYHLAKELGLKPNPPRYTLKYPTFSGNFHQFDNSFTFKRIIYVIECKRREVSAKDHIYYFNSKILDYLFGAKVRRENLPMKGIFLSTIEVGESSMIYAIAYGITVIDPRSPPIEHMLLTSKEDSPVHKALEELRQKLPDQTRILDFEHTLTKKPADLYKKYRYLCKRWEDELPSAK